MKKFNLRSIAMAYRVNDPGAIGGGANASGRKPLDAWEKQDKKFNEELKKALNPTGETTNKQMKGLTIEKKSIDKAEQDPVKLEAPKFTAQ